MQPSVSAFLCEAARKASIHSTKGGTGNVLGPLAQTLVQVRAVRFTHVRVSRCISPQLQRLTPGGGAYLCPFEVNRCKGPVQVT